MIDKLQRARGGIRVSGNGASMPPASKPLDTSTYTGRMAKRLQSLRTQRGLSVVEFHAALKKRGLTINKSLIYAWETGKKTIHPNDFPAVAKALGVTIHELLPDK